MAKTLTPLQESIVADALTRGPSETLYLQKGQYASVRSLIARGLIDRHAHGLVDRRHVLPALRSIFFGENKPAFKVEGLYRTEWLVFDHGELIAKVPCSRTAGAERIVDALNLLHAEEAADQKQAA